MVDIDIVLSTALATMVPVLLAGLGESISELSGIYNIGIEGALLMGAVMSFIAAVTTGNVIIGLLAGIGAGALFGAVTAFFAVTMKSDLILLGVGMYLFGLYFSSFLGEEFQNLMGISGIHYLHLNPIAIPFLNDVPALNVILGQQNILFYVSIIMVPAVWFFLFKTQLGLRIRATGEDPRSADSLGVNVFRIRYLAVIVGTCLMAFGGAYLVVGESGRFVDNITAGIGFVALALVWVGKWKPQWILLVTLLFGLLRSLQLLLQLGQAVFPYEFLQTFPYLAGIIALAVSVKFRTWNAPKALGQTYSRE